MKACIKSSCLVLKLLSRLKVRISLTIGLCGICFLAVHFMLLPNAMHIVSSLPFVNGPIWEELLFERWLTMSHSPSTSDCMAVLYFSRSVAISILP